MSGVEENTETTEVGRHRVEIESTEVGQHRADTEQTEPGGSRSDELHLLVMGPDIFNKVPLVRGQSLVIGRSKKADVRLEDPRASREHARVHVDDQIRIEDLGSANGTRLRDAELDAKRPYEVGAGEPIAIGSTILMVQRAWAVGRPKRLWTHGDFEARLEEECARAERSGAKLAVLRVHLETGRDSDVAGYVAEYLRPGDVLASYGPTDLETLLVDIDGAAARHVSDRIVKCLADRGVKARSGLACYPEDGRVPERLIAQACALVFDKREVSGAADTPSTRIKIDAGAGAVVVRSEAMKRLYELAERFSKGTISVLILGETGVGKEVLAETIHRSSPRANQPFVRLNCAAFSETLIESELFGHERGSFTGAAVAKQGLLETADGGTVFLDEVGELPPTLQAKLLRVLETREVSRVGALKPRKVDVRFLAATNRDLDNEVMRGRFRQDLYFRLNGVTLLIPPLRERMSELPHLCELFVRQAAERLERTPPRLSNEALDVLQKYWWPGNVRELKNVLERAVLLSTGDEVLPEHLPLDKMVSLISEPTPGRRRMRSSRPAPGDMRQAILDALTQCAGNQSRAAKLLGISRRTLVTRLNELGVPRPRK